MNSSSLPDYTHQLQQLMQRVGVSSFKALSQQAGVSKRQLKRLRRGEISQMRVSDLVSLSQALQVSTSELLATFSEAEMTWEAESAGKLAALQQEYARSQTQLEQQRQSLIQEFQLSSLQTLESLLRYWPTAAHKAQEDPQMSAPTVLRLLRPLEQLLQQWGVEAIAPVGAEVPYDPQVHQLKTGTAQPGERVKVRYTGYRQGERLLFRAEVSLLSPTE